MFKTVEYHNQTKLDGIREVCDLKDDHRTIQKESGAGSSCTYRCALPADFHMFSKGRLLESYVIS